MAGNIATSMISTFMRANNGIQSTPAAEKPEQMLQLYDIENCPYCRLVREALTELDLDAEIYPCPKQGQRFRPQVVERGGKAQFPYLVDWPTCLRPMDSAPCRSSGAPAGYKPWARCSPALPACGRE